MAHPHKAEATDAINAKMRRMTTHYGEANPKMNIKAPTEKFKIEGPESHVGFGADADAVSSRADRPRRSPSANPVATYKRGGKAAYEAGGGVCAPAVSSRARGGRLGHKGHKGSTHVNVVVAPQGQGAAPPMAPPPALAALAPKPPMAGPPPAMPPAGGPPPMAGPAGPPAGAPMMRKRGGHVNHADEAQDKALIHKELKAQGLIRRADGGAVTGLRPKNIHLHGGGDSGPGRLERNKSFAKHGVHKKQEV